jgi:hypothetical protein
MKAPSWSTATIVAAALLLVVTGIAADRIVDDTYITLRYSRNWAEGNGPVFNPGERVEGYTNFLWMALLAAVNKVAPTLDLARVAQAMSLVAGAGLVLLAGFAARRRLGAIAGAAVALLLALHSPLAAWSIAGLETPFAALLVLGAWATECARPERPRARLATPLLLALATMTRPDAIVFLPVVALLRLRTAPAQRLASLRHATAGVLLFALVYGPYFAWRWSWYGWLVPNTFYAKVGGNAAEWWRGVDYVRDWTRIYGVMLLPLAAFGAWRTARTEWGRAATGFALAALLYVVSVGGESLGYYRFMVVVAPFVALLIAAGAVDAVAHARPQLRALLRLAVALLIVATAWRSARPFLGTLLFQESSRKPEPRSGLSFPGNGRDHSFVWFDNYFVARQRVAAEWLQAHAPPGSLVAATPAGSIAWHMRLPLLDMLGLNDLHIAHVAIPNMGSGRAGHEKGDGSYVLSRRPRYVLLGNVAVFDRPIEEAEIEGRLKFRSERELWALPEFQRDYERKAVRVGESGPFQWFTFWELRGS